MEAIPDGFPAETIITDLLRPKPLLELLITNQRSSASSKIYSAPHEDNVADFWMIFSANKPSGFPII